MSQPKVSIVVPCWGVEKYLDECVESLVNQTLQDIEIILVDDVSPDSVPQMCDKWAQKDTRIKVVHKAQNEGLGMACNTGIEFATGEYVAFCDSDDWVDAEMYETMYNAAVKNQCDAVFTGLKCVDMEGNPSGHLEHKTSFQLYRSEEEINIIACDIIASSPSIRLDRTIQMSAKVVLYNRTIIEEKNIRFTSERIIPSEDLHFNLHILANARKVIVLPDMFYNYRCNPTSISQNIRTDKFERYKNLYKYTVEEVESLHLGSDAKTRVMRMLIGYVRKYLCQVLTSKLDKHSKHTIVDSICKDDFMINIINNYPTGIMPLPHRFFCWAMLHNRYALLHLLALKNK